MPTPRLLLRTLLCALAAAGCAAAPPVEVPACARPPAADCASAAGCLGPGVSAAALSSPADDAVTAVAVDAACRLRVAGNTRGELAAPARGQDVFAAALSPAFVTRWLRQLGSPGDDTARALAMGADGAGVLVGSAEGPFAGLEHQGESDLVALAFLEGGATAWQAQRGTPDYDYGLAAALDADGTVVVAGSTRVDPAGDFDLWVERLGPGGEARWSRRTGTPAAERAEAVAIGPDGDLWLAGATLGAYGGPHRGSTDVFVERLSPAGVRRFVVQVGTPDIDAALRVLPDADGAWVLAVSYSDLETGALENDGRQSAFLLRVDAQGAVRSVRRLTDAGAHSRAQSLVRAPDGGLYVAGLTDGGLDGPSRGGRDLFVARLGSDGATRWLRQLGTPGNDEALALAVAPDGWVLVGGSTTWDLQRGGVKADRDALLAWVPPDP